MPGLLPEPRWNRFTRYGLALLFLSANVLWAWSQIFSFPNFAGVRLAGYESIILVTLLLATCWAWLELRRSFPAWNVLALAACAAAICLVLKSRGDLQHAIYWRLALWFFPAAVVARCVSMRLLWRFRNHAYWGWIYRVAAAGLCGLLALAALFPAFDWRRTSVLMVAALAFYIVTTPLWIDKRGYREVPSPACGLVWIGFFGPGVAWFHWDEPISLIYLGIGIGFWIFRTVSEPLEQLNWSPSDSK